MHLNPKIESFYKKILDYAGISVEDGVLKNKDEKMGEISIDGFPLVLPYYEKLKNNKGEKIFHLLNENYVNPEIEAFDLYKQKLTVEINIKLSSLIIDLISLGADPTIQQKIKNPKLIELASQIGEVDFTTIENFMQLIKHSRKVHNENFIVGFYLKKNGKIEDTPYSAIGKVNFTLYKELCEALNSSNYKVCNFKLRKKDILALINIFKILFPHIDEKDYYVVGVDNKVFRFLETLLRVSALITSRINEVASWLESLEEPSLRIKEIISDLSFLDDIEELKKMNEQIRLIPSDVDVVKEAKRKKEEEVKKEVPQFNPQMLTDQQEVNNQVDQQAQPIQTVNEYRVPTPEEIVRGTLVPPQTAPVYPGYPALPAYPAPQAPIGGYIPQWMQNEIMKEQMQRAAAQQIPIQYQNQGAQPVPVYVNQQPVGYPQGYPQMPPQGYPPGYPQGYPMGYPQGYPPGYFQMPMQSQGLELNPILMGRTAAPFQ